LDNAVAYLQNYGIKEGRSSSLPIPISSPSPAPTPNANPPIEKTPTSSSKITRIFPSTAERAKRRGYLLDIVLTQGVVLSSNIKNLVGK
jgi:hypothetical protein